MSDYRTDSYQEMKALLQDRLDSIVEMDADEEESGAAKWGKRAAKVALGAGLAVGAAYGGKKALNYAAGKNPANKGLQKWNRRANSPKRTFGTIKRKVNIMRAPKLQGPKMSGPVGPRTKTGNF